MIILDENIDAQLIDTLRNLNYHVYSIREESPGISDREIVQLVKSSKGLLITEDKDFGELVFAHQMHQMSVVYLKFDRADYRQIEEALLKVINDYYDTSRNFFITIDKKKIRVVDL